MNIHRLSIEPFVAELRNSYRRMYGSSNNTYGEIIEWAGRLALENLSNADLLYHNKEHTMVVTLVAQEILAGKHLNEGGVTPGDWLHFIIATLCHDIGYLHGICRGDGPATAVCDMRGNTVEIDGDLSGAQLSPYHVDRSKVFIHERFNGNQHIDPERIASYIEMTRFPPPDDAFYRPTDNFRGLVRAADLIGQLADPAYLSKIPALFYEFAEMGVTEKLGYAKPGDMRRAYAHFFWGQVRKYIARAIDYLRVSQSGREWVASLHAHVFEIEHAQPNDPYTTAGEPEH